MRFDAITEPVRFTDVNARCISSRGLGNQKVQARPVKLGSSKHFVHRASRRTDSATAPLVDFCDAGTSRAIIVEEVDRQLHSVSISSGAKTNALIRRLKHRKPARIETVPRFALRLG